MIDLVLLKCLNAFGKLAVTCSLVGHEIKNFNSRYKKLIHVVKILLMLEGCTPTKSPNTSTSSPRLRRTKVMTNSSFSESFRFGPALRACKNWNYSNFVLVHYKFNDVCETLMPLALTSPKMAIFRTKSRSRSQCHWTWRHLKGSISRVQYACQRRSLYLLRFKSYDQG